MQDCRTSTCDVSVIRHVALLHAPAGHGKPWVFLFLTRAAVLALPAGLFLLVWFFISFTVRRFFLGCVGVSFEVCEKKGFL